MKELQPYCRMVNYYETDRMGIVHHSNYIRWFEEARGDFMAQYGLNYIRMEQEGIVIPVLSVSVTYRMHLTFGDVFSIMTTLKRFNGIKFSCAYEVRNRETGVLCTTGESTHCILNRDLKPFRFRKEFPAYYEIFQTLAEEAKEKDGGKA